MDTTDFKINLDLKVNIEWLEYPKGLRERMLRNIMEIKTRYAADKYIEENKDRILQEIAQIANKV